MKRFTQSIDVAGEQVSVSLQQRDGEKIRATGKVETAVVGHDGQFARSARPRKGGVCEFSDGGLRVYANPPYRADVFVYSL
jgi:hypothetical protein